MGTRGYAWVGADVIESMAALPPLVNLRIHEAPVGTPRLQLARAGVVADRGASTKSKVAKGAGPAAVEMYQPGGGDGSTDMTSLIDELTATSNTGSTLVESWRLSLATNLRTKQYQYEEQLQETEERLREELRLQNEVWAKATGRTDGRLPDGEKSMVIKVSPEAADGQWDSNKLDVVDSKMWEGLMATQAATNKILQAIEARLAKLGDTTRWHECVAALINALQQLLDDYPDLSALLQKVVAIVRAFIRAPMVLSKQFLNMLIMGDAGTGKTRLAETVGPIFARLGLYVYEEVVVASANDFIGEFVGQTEKKTAKFLAKHAEKVIFLDEAYSLTLWEEKTPGKRRLAGYSPEAVAQLIAVLSQSVGQFLFIAAGYEREMREDFLAANDGFDRRFPIRVVLEAPTNQTLVRAFFGAVAEAVVGPAPPPSAHDRLLSWKANKRTVVQAVKHWFSDSAICLLCDVLDAAREVNDNYEQYCDSDDDDSDDDGPGGWGGDEWGERDRQDEAWCTRFFEQRYGPTGLEAMQRATYDHNMTDGPAPGAGDEGASALWSTKPPCTLASMFKAGAGAMVNLAGTAAVLIISSADFANLYEANAEKRMVVDERAMRSILLAFISDKHSQSQHGAVAARELDDVLETSKWIMRGDAAGQLVWSGKTSETPCVQDEPTKIPLKGRDIKGPTGLRLPPADGRRGRGERGGDQALIARLSAFVNAVEESSGK